MNSKERVKKALKLEVPDRIPLGEFAVDFDTVEKVLGHETYLRAKLKSQIAFWEGRRDEVVQSWKEDTVEFHKKLGCYDIVNLGAIFSAEAPPKDYVPDPPKKIDNKTWEGKDGKIYKLSEVTQDISVIHDPHLWDTEYEPSDYPADVVYDAPDESVFEAVDYIIKHLGDEKFILGASGGEVGMVLLGNMERGMTEFLTNPDTVKAAARHQINLAVQGDKYSIRPGTDGIIWGQDFAYKNGPMISPEMWREFVFPVLKERCDHIHQVYNLPVIKHACGNNWALLDMFAEIGFDCYQSIQPTADMDIKDVKEKYGRKICLWGGIPLEHIVSGTRDDIIKDVRYAVESAKTGGGYIMGSSHSIAVGSNYDNFMTMLDEFEKLRYCY